MTPPRPPRDRGVEDALILGAMMLVVAASLIGIGEGAPTLWSQVVMGTTLALLYVLAMTGRRV